MLIDFFFYPHVNDRACVQLDNARLVPHPTTRLDTRILDSLRVGGRRIESEMAGLDMQPIAVAADLPRIQSMQDAFVHGGKMAINPSPSASISPQNLSPPDLVQIPTSQGPPPSRPENIPAQELSSNDFSQLTYTEANEGQTPPSSSGFSSQEYGSAFHSRSPTKLHSQPLPPTSAPEFSIPMSRDR